MVNELLDLLWPEDGPDLRPCVPLDPNWAEVCQALLAPFHEPFPAFVAANGEKARAPVEIATQQYAAGFAEGRYQTPVARLRVQLINHLLVRNVPEVCRVLQDLETAAGRSRLEEQIRQRAVLLRHL